MATVTITEQQPTQQAQQQQLPCPSEWPHRPVFVKPSAETCVGTTTNNSGACKPLPLGIPVEFETDFFKGRILVRLRDAATDDRGGKHDAYFEGRNRVTQHVIQGQFKRSFSMANVNAGCIFNQRMRLVPPPLIEKLIKIMVDRVGPGSTLDLSSDAPKVLALFAGSAQAISIDLPGQEPDISARHIEENVQIQFGDQFKSSKHRKKALSSPKIAKQYEYDTNHVYTFDFYDNSVDYASYHIKIPVLGRFSLSKAIGQQPMKFSATTKDGGDEIFCFEMWHETIYNV